MPGSNRKIIGLCPVYNEDIYIKYVIVNIAEFCDEIIVLDNESTDETAKILKCLASRFKHIEIKRVTDITRFLDYVQSYIGTNTWMICADGDEIYDPIGLKKIRTNILNGKFQKYYELRGFFFHAYKLDISSRIAKGYMAPPAKEPSKLYNLSMIDEWKPDGTAHLHARIKFNNSRYNIKSSAYVLNEKNKWDNCNYRCLHVRFLKRSSTEPDFIKGYENVNSRFLGIRLNPSDKMNKYYKGKKVIYDYRLKYRVGKRVKIDVSRFFTGSYDI